MSRSCMSGGTHPAFRTRSILFLTSALALLGLPAQAARVLDVRVGDHPTFTRIVFELDEQAQYQIEQLPAPGGIRLTVEASAAAMRLAPTDSLVEEVSIDAGTDRSVANVRLRGPVGQMTERALSHPPRIVIDLMLPAALGSAPPGEAPTPSAAQPTQQTAEVTPAPIAVAGVAGTAKAPGEPAAISPTVEAASATALSAAHASFPAAQESDGQSYPVSTFEIVYVDPNPEFPSIDEMNQVWLELGQTATGLVAPRAGVPLTRFRLGDLRQFGVQPIYQSAIRAINQQLVFEFNRRDFYAIVVTPLPEDIERRTGRDLRPAGDPRLRLGVYAGRVKDLRTFASGDRFPEDAEKLDLPEHAWILEGSPIQTESPNDLLRKDQLDAYLARLNRHPSRRVDADISPARTAGGVNLDYMVTENKPWYAYFQIENTGTEETTLLRQRFGFAHQQLFGRDDVLQLDYVTGNFNSVNGVVASYEAPFVRGGRFRGRIFGAWSQYDASVLGVPPDAAGQDPFSGTQVDTGLQLITNVFQYRELFVDTVLSAGYEWIDVNNELNPAGLQRQKESFLLGSAGLRVERFAPFSSLTGQLVVERNFGGLVNTSADDLAFLGRNTTGLEANFMTLRWDFDFSVFIEPLFSPSSWSSPSAYETKSLAHELFFSFQGQQALNSRLIPQHQSVVGGLYTVRGYPEAAVVGDDALVFTAEYRLHIPRLFSPGGKPVQVPVLGKFRGRPEYQYSYADWDLIFRTFVDVGHTGFYDKQPGDIKQNPVGSGVGLELRVLRYLTARVDAGFALKSVNPIPGTDDGATSVGDSKVNFSVRILY